MSFLPNPPGNLALHHSPRSGNVKLPIVVRRLMAARAARSLGQGALVAAFTLYLHALGWSAPEIGATLSAALLAGAVLTLAVGPLSDRRGRRRFLLLYEALQSGAALLALVTVWPPALVLAAIVGGFGRGANGSAGPFGPLEQAWLAHALPAEKRGSVFSLNAAIGFSGMALGALLAGGVQLLIGPLGAVLAYRPLFLLSLAGSVAAFVLIAGLHEPAPARSARRPAEHSERRSENRMLTRLVIANIVNGLGIGMIAPLIAYWFALRLPARPRFYRTCARRELRVRRGRFDFRCTDGAEAWADPAGDHHARRRARTADSGSAHAGIRRRGGLLRAARGVQPGYRGRAAGARRWFNARPAGIGVEFTERIDPDSPRGGAVDFRVHAACGNVESAVLRRSRLAGGLPGPLHAVLSRVRGGRGGIARL